ncbi:hypothetical protein CBA19CS22_34670 [Caballeronia novacaledonica]|uniref:Uncharacterized protein n=1 Tax=Caballeronia novacaledonica TaxID=1544861 RepID=A0ACB5R383_9BURK|nr:hypothetical protein CBA19CS22_34670 [Caballeronia novacaledonica]
MYLTQGLHRSLQQNPGKVLKREIRAPYWAQKTRAVN